MATCYRIPEQSLMFAPETPRMIIASKVIRKYRGEAFVDGGMFQAILTGVEIGMLKYDASLLRSQVNQMGGTGQSNGRYRRAIAWRMADATPSGAGCSSQRVRPCDHSTILRALRAG